MLSSTAAMHLGSTWDFMMRCLNLLKELTMCLRSLNESCCIYDRSELTTSLVQDLKL